MRRLHGRAISVGRIFILGLLVIAVGPNPASAAELTLKRVMLSAAGVGYFEYESDVDGTAQLGLDIPLEQVDDVLKSLVVFDSAGGVGDIVLPGRDGRHAAFGDVPFGPEALKSPLAYLNALQGVEVIVQGPRPMRGQILRAESVPEAIASTPAGPSPRLVPRTRISLLAAEGLRQFVLEDAEIVQIADPALRQRVARALAALQSAAGRDMRHLTLRAEGIGKRTVRVGYVAATPLWKATYRLVLPAGEAGTARLQGWAVLENQTGIDWDNVALTLQYGNPVTFRQALYRSYFAQRPEVPVEVLGRVLPDVDVRSRPALAAAPKRPAPAGQAALERRMAMPMAAAVEAVGAGRGDNMAAPVEAAQLAEGTEQTTFQLAKPVSLPAGHSLSVPILDQPVEAERLAFATGARAHPLAAIRITNATGGSLPAGVLTLYDRAGEAAFAGDARLGGLPAGERRLLAFAEDLRTGVERHVSTAHRLVAVSAAQGVLRLAYRDRREVKLVLTAPTREARQVLVEIAKQEDRTLSLPGGAMAGMEETATAWRLPLALQANETRTLLAYLDRTLHEDISLLGGDWRDVLVRLLADTALPDAARQALERLAELRRDEDAKRAELARLANDLAAVERDEDRIRRNLAAVRAGDALHARLLRQLDEDETKIAQLRAAIAQATKAADAAHRALTEAVAALKL